MTQPRIAEDELLAYADARLDRARRAAVAALIDADADARAAVEAYRAQNRLVAEAADALAPATVDLRTAALERSLAQRLTKRRRRPLLRLGQLAAGIALFVAGWLAHDWAATDDEHLPGYVMAATGAHGLFAEDPVRPVELGEAGSRAAVDWLSAKLGQPIAVPALEPLGLEFLGTRLHGTEDGPLVQFVYEDARAQRLSLFMAPHAPGTPPIAYAQTEVSGDAVGYWSDTTTDYALVAKASPAPLAEIAAVIGDGTSRR